MIASIIPELSLEAEAALLAIVGDPTRLGILRQLHADGPTCVCHLDTAPGVAPNLLSYHLKMLRESGLVRTRRLGRMIEYTLAEDALDRLHSSLPSRTSSN